MEYILFIHNNSDSPVTKDQWDIFIAEANKIGIFRGGSEIANSTVVGNKNVSDITRDIGGFMRFESEDINNILDLLTKHPIVNKGGSVQLCEMPKS